MKKSAIVLSSLVFAAAAFGAEEGQPAQSAVDEKIPWTPLELCLASPLQVPFECWNVYGLRLSVFFGQSRDVYGLDLGLVGRTSGDMFGLQAGGFNWVENWMAGAEFGAVANLVNGDATGLQVAGALNYDTGLFQGFQCAFVNCDKNFEGLQVGAINWNYGLSAGLQIGVANANPTDEYAGWAIGAVNCAVNFTGAQFGAVNAAEKMTGFQLGLFNAATTLNGVQIGVLNVAGNAALPILPVCNGRF